MRITLPNLDDSRSPYEALQPSSYGFPSAILTGLYLMTGQHMNGESIIGGNVADSSGHDNHAAYQIGGSAVQRAWGQEFIGHGGGFTTPIPVNAGGVAGGMVVSGVIRQTFAEAPATGRYPTAYMPSDAVSADVSLGSDITKDGVLVTQQIGVADNGALNLGIFLKSAVLDGAQRKAVRRDLVSSQSFYAWALSVNFVTNEINFISSAGSFSTVDADAVAIIKASTANHSFGTFRVGSNDPMPGDVCLAAVGNIFLPMAQLQSWFDNTRRIVRARGAEVV